MIRPLFEVEKQSQLAGDNALERTARRAEHSAPALDKLRAWLEKHKGIIPPTSTLGRAIKYLDNQWPRLLLFLEDGNIELTNNRRERELRALVLGKKNWLSSGTTRAEPAPPPSSPSSRPASRMTSIPGPTCTS